MELLWSPQSFTFLFSSFLARLSLYTKGIFVRLFARFFARFSARFCVSLFGGFFERLGATLLLLSFAVRFFVCLLEVFDGCIYNIFKKRFHFSPYAIKNKEIGMSSLISNFKN
jgi:hypothetical protein